MKNRYQTTQQIETFLSFRVQEILEANEEPQEKSAKELRLEKSRQEIAAIYGELA